MNTIEVTCPHCLKKFRAALLYEHELGFNQQKLITENMLLKEELRLQNERIRKLATPLYEDKEKK